MKNVPIDFAVTIKKRRAAKGWTQAELAEKMGVTNVTISRWEQDKVKPSRLLWERFLELAGDSDTPAPTQRKKMEIPAIDFMGDGNAVRAFVEGERLAYGHLVNPAFATEISKIDPLPHQRIAVYDHMLRQPRLRYLLADDAGAGKTIMTGLYCREMLSRHLIKRILIVPPAGLVGNWQNEMRDLFGLDFKVLSGLELRSTADNPFADPLSDLVICSIDTLRGANAFDRLAADGVTPYDLVVFDEAHKLSARQDTDLTIRKSTRYELAEALAGVPNRKKDWDLTWSARHLLLLTATPHMGKDYPYYALWRLLDPQAFSTQEAFRNTSLAQREKHFIRRTKEEMVTFDGKPIYPKRSTNTFSYNLTQGEISEQALYDKTTDYLRFVYNRAKLLNRTAAQLALSVFQRRLASSTYALMRSLERRLDRLDELIDKVVSGRVDMSRLAREAAASPRVDDPFDSMTADEELQVGDHEQNEDIEGQILGQVVATTVAELQMEQEYVQDLLQLAVAVKNAGHESKFERVHGILQDKRFKNEKILIFTEHRDTLHYLETRFRGLGYEDEIATIHGGMDYLKRGDQVEFFRRPVEKGGARVMICTDAAGEGINLQFCWVMINFDVPWNPARLEQRMGRIHRYGQKKPEVFIFNVIAGSTREGRVVKTLLDKLETIRRELKSEKVFDVIGHVFEGVQLSKFMTDVLNSDDVDSVLAELGGHLTKEQVEAVLAREARLYGDGGDVAAALPALKERMDAEVYSQLLPGYVQQYMMDSADLLKISLARLSETEYQLFPKRPRALDPFSTILAREEDGKTNISFVRNPANNKAIWVHPGEPFFEMYRELVTDIAAHDALRGAVVVDPSTTESYLLHLATVQVLRRSDPGLPEFTSEELVEYALLAIRQDESGDMEVRPVEEFLLFEPGTGALPADAQRLAVSAQARVEEARAHLVGSVAKGMVQKHRNKLSADLPERLEQLRRGFSYQQEELVKRRINWRKKKREGHPGADREIERVRELQSAWQERLDDAQNTIIREPGLIGVGKVEFLAHALVRPAASEQESMRYDAEVERIAMEQVMAYERASGARVYDVHTPELALKAGLTNQNPGFDILSMRDGGKRCIEVKGRSRTGAVHISPNEWAAAANRRAEYWLYAVFDCASSAPRMVAVQDPFGKLITKTTGYELTSDQILAEGEVL